MVDLENHIRRTAAAILTREAVAHQNAIAQTAAECWVKGITGHVKTSVRMRSRLLRPRPIRNGGIYQVNRKRRFARNGRGLSASYFSRIKHLIHVSGDVL